MDLTSSAELAAFGKEVDHFLAGEWAPAKADDAGAVADFLSKGIAKGFLYRSVPRRYGGSEQPQDLFREQIVARKFAEAEAPRRSPGVGAPLLIPTLLAHGREWQRERFIPPIVRGDELWAQGYSEPGAGSDLASLTTRADLRGGRWHIDGRKIWSSGADRARFMFALVRTEAEAGRGGISYLLLDLQQPGVRVRPIRQINGAASFCEVEFTDAVTPADWIIGGRGEGWAVSTTTLTHERNFVGSAVELRALFADLIRLARGAPLSGAPLADPIIRRRLAALEGRIEAHDASNLHQITLATEGRSPGRLGLLNKLSATSIVQEVWSIAAEMLGEAAGSLPQRESTGPRSAAQWAEFGMRAMSRSIAGGTSNIQRDIIARRGLGLPQP